jgi:hypothetical protein
MDITLCPGTHVDTTIIDALSSSKNKGARAGHEMSFTKKGI